MTQDVFVAMWTNPGAYQPDRQVGLHYQIHRGGMSGRPIDPQEWLAEHGVTV